MSDFFLWWSSTHKLLCLRLNSCLTAAFWNPSPLRFGKWQKQILGEKIWVIRLSQKNFLTAFVCWEILLSVSNILSCHLQPVVLSGVTSSAADFSHFKIYAVGLQKTPSACTVCLNPIETTRWNCSDSLMLLLILFDSSLPTLTFIKIHCF